MSQISNGMKIYNSKYLAVKINIYEKQLKWLLAKRNNFPNFENFKKGFLDLKKNEFDKYASLEPP